MPRREEGQRIVAMLLYPRQLRDARRIGERLGFVNMNGLRSSALTVKHSFSICCAKVHVRLSPFPLRGRLGRQGAARPSPPYGRLVRAMERFWISSPRPPPRPAPKRGRRLATVRCGRQSRRRRHAGGRLEVFNRVGAGLRRKVGKIYITGRSPHYANFLFLRPPGPRPPKGPAD